MGKMQQKMSQRQERELEAEWPEAERTVGSGNKWQKADLQTQETQNIDFVIECKSTQSNSFSITKSIWNTVKSHAQNKSWTSRPILAVRLYGPTIEMTEWGERENTAETLPVELDLICMGKDDWLEFYYDYLRLKELENG